MPTIPNSVLLPDFEKNVVVAGRDLRQEESEIGCLSVVDLIISIRLDTVASSSSVNCKFGILGVDFSSEKDRCRKSVGTRPRGGVFGVRATSMTTGSWSEDRANKQELEVGKVRIRVTKKAKIKELCLRFVGNRVWPSGA